MVQNLNKIKVEHDKEKSILKMGVFLDGKQEGVHQYIHRVAKIMKYYVKGRMILRRLVKNNGYKDFGFVNDATRFNGLGHTISADGNE